MGAHKKPMALRELHGTANKNVHRNNDDAPVPERGIGEPPENMEEGVKEIWYEVTNIIYNGVMGEGDRLSLEIMCNLFYRFRYGVKGTEIEPLLGAELARLVSLLSLFGMTPADRARVNAPKGQSKNKFTSL